MLGLIKKDLLLIKSNLKTLVFMFIFFGIMTYLEMFDATFMLPYISIMLFVSTFSYDDFNKWNAYAISFPNGRKCVIKSKYIATLLLLIITSFIGIISSTILSSIKGTINFENLFSSLFGSVFSIIILIAIMYPLIIKYGSEKGRMVLFLVVTIIVLGVTAFSKIIDIAVIINFLKYIENYLMIILPLSLIIILFISYKISEKIYLKKEF